ncbi:hypothetical protein Vi05172_g2895 [Venturia inaequalis]|nr:hypothetical protein Vi05172_g2895 [Venturia inaequalis]
MSDQQTGQSPNGDLKKRKSTSQTGSASKRKKAIARLPKAFENKDEQASVKDGYRSFPATTVLQLNEGHHSIEKGRYEPLDLSKLFAEKASEVEENQIKKLTTEYKRVFDKADEKELLVEVVDLLKEHICHPKRWLKRAWTLFGVHSTAGFSCPDYYWPNAKRNGKPMHKTLFDIPFATFRHMLGDHLMWEDPPLDELLSWTDSWLFVIVHALGRYESGQRIAVITCGRASGLTTPNGQSALFYHANELHNAYRLLDRVWKIGQKDSLHGDRSFKLAARKFTHEWLSHGIVLDQNHEMQHVELGELVRQGLFYLYPELDIRGLCERTGLYEHLTALRLGLFYYARQSEITTDEMAIAASIARLFCKPGQEKAPLSVLLDTLSLRKRMPRNDKFRSWIFKNYTTEEVREEWYPNIHIIPDNLPEVAQSVELLREAFAALNIEPTPQITPIHDNAGKDKNFAEYKNADLYNPSQMCVEDRNKKRNHRTQVLSNCFKKDPDALRRRRNATLQLWERPGAAHSEVLTQLLHSDNNIWKLNKEQRGANLRAIASGQFEESDVEDSKEEDKDEGEKSKDEGEKSKEKEAETKDKDDDHQNQEDESSTTTLDSQPENPSKEVDTGDSAAAHISIKNYASATIKDKTKPQTETNTAEELFAEEIRKYCKKMDQRWEARSRLGAAHRDFRANTLPVIVSSGSMDDDDGSDSPELVQAAESPLLHTAALSPVSIQNMQEDPALVPQQVLAVEDPSASNSPVVFDIIGAADKTQAAERAFAFA